MKTADVTDEQVVEACRRWHTDRVGDSSLGNLVELTGAPRKVALRAMERACGRGLIDWGVSLRTAWPTSQPAKPDDTLTAG